MDNFNGDFPQPGGDPVSNTLAGLLKTILLIVVLVIATGLVGLGFLIAVLSDVLA